MEQQNLQDNTDIEIDVLELFHVLLNKFWIILLAGIIAGLAFIGGTILFITPQYESTTKMYVLSKQDNNTLTQQDMQTSLSLTKDYAELIKSRTVTEGVIAQLNLDLTHEDLLKKMTVDSATDTRILSITVKDPSITKNGIIGGFLGVLLSVVIILIAYISNDTVKTQEDVEKYLGLSVLGTIPLTETDRKKKKKKQKQKKARGRR